MIRAFPTPYKTVRVEVPKNNSLMIEIFGNLSIWGGSDKDSEGFKSFEVSKENWEWIPKLLQQFRQPYEWVG